MNTGREERARSLLRPSGPRGCVHVVRTALPWAAHARARAGARRVFARRGARRQSGPELTEKRGVGRADVRASALA